MAHPLAGREKPYRDRFIAAVVITMVVVYALVFVLVALGHLGVL